MKSGSAFPAEAPEPSRPMRVMHVVGARPNFMKVAPVTSATRLG